MCHRQVGCDVVMLKSHEPNLDVYVEGLHWLFRTACELNSNGDPETGWPAQVTACSSSRTPPGWTCPPVHASSTSWVTRNELLQVCRVDRPDGAAASAAQRSGPGLVGSSMG